MAPKTSRAKCTDMKNVEVKRDAEQTASLQLRPNSWQDGFPDVAYATILQIMRPFSALASRCKVAGREFVGIH